MSNYTPATNFAAKDSLLSGDPAKTIRGVEFSTEFNDIATAVSTKADSFSPIFSGTVTVDDNNVNNNAAIGGTLGVTGGTTLGSTLGVTGGTTLSSTLGVTGGTTLGSTLSVTGSTTLSSTLDVTGDATLGGTLVVTGELTADLIDGGTY